MNNSFNELSAMLMKEYNFWEDEFNFILKTKNPKLIDIDIEQLIVSGDISTYARDIYEECLKNPWYFFREVLRVPTQGTPLDYMKCNKFQINEGTLCALMCYTNDISFILETPRRTGRSELLASLMLYEGMVKGNFSNNYYTINTTNTNDFIVNKVKALLEINTPVLQHFPVYKGYSKFFDAELNKNIGIRREEVSQTGRGYRLRSSTSVFVGDLEFYLNDESRTNDSYIKRTIYDFMINGVPEYQHLYAESCIKDECVPENQSTSIINYILDYGLPQLNIATLKRLFYYNFFASDVLKNIAGKRPVRIRFNGDEMALTKNSLKWSDLC